MRVLQEGENLCDHSREIRIRSLNFGLWEAAMQAFFQCLRGIAKVDSANTLCGRGNQNQPEKAWSNRKADVHVLCAILVDGRFHAKRCHCLFVEAAAGTKTRMIHCVRYGRVFP